MDGDIRRVAISRGVGFYTAHLDARAGRPLGRAADPGDRGIQDVVPGQAIVTLVEPLGRFQPGSVVAFDIPQMLAGQKPAPTLVMAPSKSQAIEEVSASDNVLWVKALDDVSGKLFALRRQADGTLGGADDAAARPTARSISPRPRASRTSPSPPSRVC